MPKDNPGAYQTDAVLDTNTPQVEFGIQAEMESPYRGVFDNEFNRRYKGNKPVVTYGGMTSKI